MADINLLQNQLKDTTHVAQKRTQWAAIASGIVLGMVVVGCVLLSILTGSINTKVGEINQENGKLKEEISTGNKKLTAAKSYQAQLSNIDLLLENHIYMSRLVKELEKFTYNRTQFLTLDLDQNTSKAHLEGQSDSYEGVGKLLLGLSTSTNFNNVKLESVSMINGDTSRYYRYSVDFQVLPGIFVNP